MYVDSKDIRYWQAWFGGFEDEFGGDQLDPGQGLRPARSLPQYQAPRQQVLILIRKKVLTLSFLNSIMNVRPYLEKNIIHNSGRAACSFNIIFRKKNQINACTYKYWLYLHLFLDI